LIISGEELMFRLKKTHVLMLLVVCLVFSKGNCEIVNVERDGNVRVISYNEKDCFYRSKGQTNSSDSLFVQKTCTIPKEDDDQPNEMIGWVDQYTTDPKLKESLKEMLTDSEQYDEDVHFELLDLASSTIQSSISEDQYSMESFGS
jgi:hypothetical protein